MCHLHRGHVWRCLCSVFFLVDWEAGLHEERILVARFLWLCPHMCQVCYGSAFLTALVICSVQRGGLFQQINFRSRCFTCSCLRMFRFFSRGVKASSFIMLNTVFDMRLTFRYTCVSDKSSILPLMFHLKLVNLLKGDLY